MVPPPLPHAMASNMATTSRVLPHHGGSGMSLDTSKRRVGGGGGGLNSRGSPEPSTSIPLIEFHAPSAEGGGPSLPPLRALGPPAYNRPPPPPSLPNPPPPNQYPSTPGGGRFGIRQPPPKLRSSPMRSSTFAAGDVAVQGRNPTEKCWLQLQL